MWCFLWWALWVSVMAAIVHGMCHVLEVPDAYDEFKRNDE